MFKTNVGGIDRILRIVVGLALIAAFFLVSSGTGWSYLLLLGVVPLATGIFQTCPAYSLIGVSTCPMKKA